MNNSSLYKQTTFRLMVVYSLLKSFLRLVNPCYIKLLRHICNCSTKVHSATTLSGLYLQFFLESSSSDTTKSLNKISTPKQLMQVTLCQQNQPSTAFEQFTKFGSIRDMVFRHFLKGTTRWGSFPILIRSRSHLQTKTTNSGFTV